MSTVLITGTSTGIGLACTQRMAAEGWTVLAGVRRQDDADRVAAEVPGDVRPVLVDVADADQVEAAASTVAEVVGDAGLDGLVNNAGIAVGGPLELLPDEEWRRSFEVNVFGLVAMTRAVFPLLEAAQGRIVNVTSLAGRLGMPLMGPYVASKHAVEGLTEALCLEVAHLGIRVISVAPGEVRTAIWDKASDAVEAFEEDFGQAAVQRYEDQVDGLHAFIEEGATKGVEPPAVAERVHQALTASRPRDRYVVGVDAKVGEVVSRTPTLVRGALLRANARRYQSAGRKRRSDG